MTLVIALIFATAMIYLPNFLTVKAEQSAWLAPWLGLPLSVGLAYVVVNLHRRYPGRTLIEYAPEILGKVLGKTVGALYVWWFFHVAATVIQEHSLFLDSTILIATPGAVFYGSLALLAVYILWRGLPVLLQLNQLLLPLILVFMLGVVLLVAPEMEPGNLKPIISHAGLPGLLDASVSSAGWLAEVVVLGMFLPYVKPGVRLTREIALGLVIATFSVSFLIAGIIAVFNAGEAARLQLPLYSLIRFVSVGDFLNRLDVLAIPLWVVAVTVKFGLWFFAGVLGLSQLAGLKTSKGLLPAAVFFVVALSTLLYDNIAQMTTFLAEVLPLYFLVPFEIGLPAVLLATALLRKEAVK